MYSHLYTDRSVGLCILSITWRGGIACAARMIEKRLVSRPAHQFSWVRVDKSNAGASRNPNKCLFEDDKIVIDVNFEPSLRSSS